MIDIVKPFGGFDYVFPNDPDLSVNPGYTGKTWLNSSTGLIYVCVDATEDLNIWVSQQGGQVYPGSYRNFNGTSDKINITMSGITGAAARTVELRFTLNAYPASNASLFAMGSTAATRNSMGIYVTSGGVLMSINFGDNDVNIGSIVTGQEYLLSVTYNGTTGLIYYLDGVQTDSRTLGGTLNTNSTFVVGEAAYESGLYANMRARELRIWDKALSPTKVLEYYPKVVLPASDRPIAQYHYFIETGYNNLISGSYNGTLTGTTFVAV